MANSNPTTGHRYPRPVEGGPAGGGGGYHQQHQYRAQYHQASGASAHHHQYTPPPGTAETTAAAAAAAVGLKMPVFLSVVMIVLICLLFRIYLLKGWASFKSWILPMEDDDDDEGGLENYVQPQRTSGYSPRSSGARKRD